MVDSVHFSLQLTSQSWKSMILSHLGFIVYTFFCTGGKAGMLFLSLAQHMSFLPLLSFSSPLLYLFNFLVLI
jgi:hypothetical protein